ncbi:IclR family transcriptional regulator [Ottowia thiooxydans]|uniref:DNA-binding IclR family transcriptional regulator n=1 Tax=Ottowia thiooxydans TaxID=219182 RepID=A0ABV2QA68_9BURK
MPKTPSIDTPYMVPAVNRSIQILRYLQRNKKVTVTDVAHALGVGPSTCYAILKTLQHHNFIAFDERTKTYSLGLALLELGGSVSRDFTSVHKARSHLSTYARETGLTVFVAARASHEHLLVVDREEPPGDVRVDIAVGTRFRITEGLSGRCFMAYLPEEECDALIESLGLHPFAGLPAPSPAMYRAQLRATRKAGFVTLVDLPQRGSNGVAAPIFDSEGRVLFAVAAMGLSPSITGKAIKETGATLRRTTDLITHSLNETAT